jgi:hypothetical protein
VGTRSRPLQQPSPLFYELPTLDDWLEPGVEFFVRRHLVEKAAVDEPDSRVSPIMSLLRLFCTNWFIPRFDLGFVVQNYVQQ